MQLLLKRSIGYISIVLFIASVGRVSPVTVSYSLPSPKIVSEKIKTIVIDPGHGGHDSGCLGSSSKEKDVALAISLKLGEYIQKNFPDVKVVYTRKTDVFVELYRRAQIANENKADLFICIHCNSGPKPAFGAETYVMGVHKTEGNLSVAKRENEVILKENDYKKSYDGYDPNSAEADIIFSLYQSAFLERSLSFAQKCQDEFRTHANRYDRKVRQAGFLVLWKTTMPSVLIETGFLTNDKEHDFLSGTTGKDLMAQSIYRAFVKYIGEVESVDYSAKLAAASKTATSPADTVVTPTPPKPEAPKVKKEVTLPKEVNTPEDKPITINPKIEKPAPKEIPPPAAEKPAEVATPITEATKGIVYKVQFYSSPTYVNNSSAKFKNLANVDNYYYSGSYRYTTGNFTNAKDALAHQKKVAAAGFKDCFIVVFEDGKRVSEDRRRELMR